MPKARGPDIDDALLDLAEGKESAQWETGSLDGYRWVVDAETQRMKLVPDEDSSA